MFIVNIIAIIVIIIMIYLILSINNELETERIINQTIIEKQEQLIKENDKLRRENKLLEDEINKMPRVEKVSKPRAKKTTKK